MSVLGYDPAERSRELRRRIGIVLQSGGIYRHIKPREAMRYWAGFYPHPRDVEEVIELAGPAREGRRAQPPALAAASCGASTSRSRWSATPS